MYIKCVYVIDINHMVETREKILNFLRQYNLEIRILELFEICLLLIINNNNKYLSYVVAISYSD